jgi:hypothetical protein
MQSIYVYSPETSLASRVHNIAAILYLQYIWYM